MGIITAETHERIIVHKYARVNMCRFRYTLTRKETLGDCLLGKSFGTLEQSRRNRIFGRGKNRKDTFWYFL